MSHRTLAQHDARAAGIFVSILLAVPLISATFIVRVAFAVVRELRFWVPAREQLVNANSNRRPASVYVTVRRRYSVHV